MFTSTTGIATLATVISNGVYPTSLGCVGFLEESAPIYGAVGRTPINQVSWNGMVNCCYGNSIQIWQDGNSCEAYCYATTSTELAEEYTCLQDVPWGTANAVTECIDNGSGICYALESEDDPLSTCSSTTTTSWSTTSSRSSTITSSSTSSKTSSLSTSTITSSAKILSLLQTSSTQPASTTSASVAAAASSSTTSSQGAAVTGKVEIGLAAVMLIGVLAL